MIRDVIVNSLISQCNYLHRELEQIVGAVPMREGEGGLVNVCGKCFLDQTRI
jgi:hypothetical protein